MNETVQRRSLAIAFFCAVSYALFSMTILRELVIPHFLASKEGHISADPLFYHDLALSKVREMQDRGFSAFEIRPAGQGSAGVASLLYFVFENPYSIVLLNAILHGASVILMSLILLQWFSLRTAIVASLPLAISPYMMLWFSQINKDTFSLTGALLFTYGFLRLIRIRTEPHERQHALLVLLSGILLMWIVRPYLNQIFLPVSAVILAVALWVLLRRAGGNKNDVIAFVFCGAVMLISLSLSGTGAASDETIRSFRHLEVQAPILTQSVADNCLISIDSINWKKANFIPNLIDEKLRALMGQRCLMFTILENHKNVTTQLSFIDTSKIPAGSLEALAYFPRAALWGVFAPWPDRWSYGFDHFSVFYMITAVESAIFFFGLLCLLFWLLRSRAWNALTPIFLSVWVMTIYGMATPFLGALYRYRYPWWILLICMSVAALMTMASRNLRNNR